MNTPFILESGLTLKWYVKNFIIENDYITPISDDCIFYNPFDYSEQNITKEQWIKIFNTPSPKDLNKKKKYTLPAIFASLDSTNFNMLLRWTQTFGLPFTNYFYNKNSLLSFKNFPKFEPADKHSDSTLEDKIHFNDFSKEVVIFRDMLDLYNAVRNKDKAYLIKHVKEIDPWEATQLLPLKDFSSEELYMECASIIQEDRKSLVLGEKDKELSTLISEALYLVQETMNRGLIGVRPIITFTDSDKEKIYYIKEPKWQWEFTSLLSSLYLMVFMDWVQGRSMQCCQNTKCTNYFIPSKNSSKYCSLSCQTASKQQRYRDEEKKLAKALEACISGSTLEEASSEYNIDIERLEKALRTVHNNA
ncbi:hypothetical protein [Pelosinus sp. IPA-1]|uniref:hypothetical protein n=1 Tax=Pelosinus sp. IPA-1 TaxID=3029569 RepID=UPI0024362A75|nr:hypothetical protein [Pelosinus sp. IPA-1]GMB02047.1 hypothetical protein PIPA1_48470 [Pelosinus sp. IPA-1]